MNPVLTSRRLGARLPALSVSLLCPLLMGVMSVLPSWAYATGNTATATSGITLQGTRVIYPGSTKGGVSYTLTNNTNDVYLLQTRILPLPPQVVQDDATDGVASRDDEVSQADTNDTPSPPVAPTSPVAIEALPMMVVPPLQRLEPGDKVSLRLRMVDDKVLPIDRESVFLLGLKTIPTERNDEATQKANDTLVAKGKTGVQLQMAVQNNLKVFYRPAGMVEKSAEQVSSELQFSQQGNAVVVKNPSGYYVTLVKLSVGTHEVDSAALWAMVPPFGEQRYPLPAGAQGAIRWQTLNDWGSPTEINERASSRTAP